MSRLRFKIPTIVPIAAAAVVLGACSSGGTGSDQTTVTVTASPTAQEQASIDVPQGVVDEYETVQKEIAENGGETTSGEWRVAYILEKAEPWYAPEGDQFSFRQPAPDETNHIEIIPFEASTGRIVPDVPIRLEIIDGSGDVVQDKDLNFLYSGFFHYANNFAIPAPGQYTLRATLGSPSFLRHGEPGHTPALAEGTTVEFTDVQINPGG